MATLAEKQIRDIIQAQQQEVKKLNDQVQRLKQSYETERKQRKSLEKKCKELEDIIGNERTPSNYPPAITGVSSQDLEHAARGLEYRQHREAMNQRNQYYGLSEYQDGQYPSAAPPQQHPHTALRQPNPYSPQMDNSKFVGGFNPNRRTL